MATACAYPMAATRAEVFNGTNRWRPLFAPCLIHTYSSACFSFSDKPVDSKGTMQAFGRSITDSLRRRPNVRIKRNDAPT